MLQKKVEYDWFEVNAEKLRELSFFEPTQKKEEWLPYFISESRKENL